MNYSNTRSIPLAQVVNMREAVDALRSQLEREKEMLKNDIVQTLKCQSMLGTGSADIEYTSGLLARLKSLEDDREQGKGLEVPALDHGGTTSAYCLQGRAEDETRNFAGAGEVYRSVRSAGCNPCPRHCCINSSEVETNRSGVKMRSFSCQKFPVQLDVRMRQRFEDSLEHSTYNNKPGLSQTNYSWSGDNSAGRPISKGYALNDRTDTPFPESEFSMYHPNIAYLPSEPSYNHWSHPSCSNSSCSCTVIAPPYNHPQPAPLDTLPDTCRHCQICCTKWPEVQTTSSVLNLHESRIQEDSYQCRKSSHCRHTSPIHNRFSPEVSPRLRPHYHQKVSRHNRHHQTKDEGALKRGASAPKSAGNETPLAIHEGTQVRKVASQYINILPVALETEETEESGEIEAVTSPCKLHVTPRSTSPGSTHSEKSIETLVYDGPQVTTQETAVQFHYGNEISSQKSGRSSLFGSGTALDQEVASTYVPKSPKTRLQKRRKMSKRTSKEQGTSRQGAVTLQPGIERSRSTPHPLHSRFDVAEPSPKATSLTTTQDLTRGRPKDQSYRTTSNKNRWSGTDHHHQAPTLPPPPPTIPQRKKVLKNDPLKSLETFYASLTGLPRTKGKKSERGDNLEVKALDCQKKKTPRMNKTPNQLSLLVEEFSKRPMLRNLSTAGRKMF